MSKPQMIAAGRFVILAMLLPLALSGCAMWESIDGPLPDWFARPDIPDDPVTVRSNRIEEVLRATGTEHNGVRYCAWGRTPSETMAENEVEVESVEKDQTERSYRWDYPALSALLTGDEITVADFTPYLNDDDPNVATGAAIAIVRLNNRNVTEPVVTRLCDTVGNLNLPINLRCAAAEAVSRIEPTEAVSQVRQLIDRYGRYDSTGRGHLSYQGEVTAELLEGLSELTDAADDHRLVDALSSDDHRIRLVAVRAWERTAKPAKIPDELVRLRLDPSIEVRAAAFRAMARQDGTETLEYMRHALRDTNIEVRRAAVDGLATLDDIESRDLLVDALDRQSETIRVRIIAALARIDARSDLLDAARDRSWRVRRQVAIELKNYHDRAAQIVALEFLSDPSVEVQRTILESVRNWPIEVAGHFLLSAMECTTPTTCAAAAEQLAQRWPPAQRYSVGASGIEGRRQLAELRKSFVARFGPLRLESTAETKKTEPLLTDEEIELLAVDIRNHNTKALELRGERLADELEQLSAKYNTQLPDYLFDQVLPRVSPIFEAIEALGRGNDYERRVAAGRIEQLSREKALGRLAGERICRAAMGTNDTIVWSRLIEAVAEDWNEPSMRLTQLAAGHRSLEVRRRACRKLGGSGDGRYIATLVPALADPSRDVMVEAARAIAQLCEPSSIAGNNAPFGVDRQRAIGGLKQLLGHGDKTVRLAAADALNRLDDPTGAAELQRLSYDADAGIRIGVIRSMRDRPRIDFTRTFIRLLDDRSTIRRAALEALPKIVQADPTVAAFIDQAPTNTSERTDVRQQAEKWKTWYDRATGGSLRASG